MKRKETEETKESPKRLKPEPGLDARWFHATKYSELLALNREFVEDKLYETPYHATPMQHGDKELRGKLVQLHQYGLLTECGQEALCEYGQKAPAGGYYDMEQRPYLSFYVDLQENRFLAEFLLEQLKASELKYVAYNFETNAHCSNITTKDSPYFVTRERYSKNKATLCERKWRNVTHLPYDSIDDIELDDLLWYHGHSQEILCHTMYFAVAMLEYGKGDLEAVLLEMCSQACKIGKVKTY
jgi:hypothetical protein